MGGRLSDFILLVSAGAFETSANCDWVRRGVALTAIAVRSESEGCEAVLAGRTNLCSLLLLPDDLDDEPDIVRDTCAVYGIVYDLYCHSSCYYSIMLFCIPYHPIPLHSFDLGH